MVVESSLFFLGNNVLRTLLTLLFGGFLVEISGDSPQALIGAVVLTAALWAATQD